MVVKLSLLSDIAVTKNLTLSAERMGYTQSAVSHAITKLESEMGISLLRRTNRGVELTKDGELLLPKIRSVITHYQRLQEDIDSLQGLQRGAVCIGTYSSIASQWLPAVIKSFQQLYLNITLSIREGGIDEIERWMYDGSVDFGFLSWRKHQHFKFTSIARDPLYAIVSPEFLLPESYYNLFPLTAFAEYPLFRRFPFHLALYVHWELELFQKKNYPPPQKCLSRWQRKQFVNLLQNED
ncbi:MAG: LysR family transcriptional regulator [Lachnospiraceae bacterium]